MPENDGKPLGELFGDLGRQLGTLIKREVDLAKVELSDRASRVGRDAAKVAAGGLVVHAALLILLAAAVFGLVEIGLDAWLAALIVGVIVGVGGAVVLRSGLTALRDDTGGPSPTVESLQENVEWAKELTK